MPGAAALHHARRMTNTTATITAPETTDRAGALVEAGGTVPERFERRLVEHTGPVGGVGGSDDGGGVRHATSMVKRRGPGHRRDAPSW